MIRSIWKRVFGPTEIPEAETVVVPEAVVPEPEDMEEDTEVRHEGLHLFDLNEMLLEKIMNYLTFSDLAKFSRTCTTSMKVL